MQRNTLVGMLGIVLTMIAAQCGAGSSGQDSGPNLKVELEAGSTGHETEIIWIVSMLKT